MGHMRTVWCHLGGVSARGVVPQKGVCKLCEVWEGALRKDRERRERKNTKEGERRQMPEDNVSGTVLRAEAGGDASVCRQGDGSSGKGSDIPDSSADEQ